MCFVNGESFHKDDFAANLFYILGVLNKGAVETDPFARRCLIEMIEKGFNANLISEITGYKETVYKKVCDIVNANKEQKKKRFWKSGIESKGHKALEGYEDLVFVTTKNTPRASSHQPIRFIFAWLVAIVQDGVKVV